MPHITEFTNQELKQELERRKIRDKKLPLYIRQPLWWKMLDWVTDYIGAWFLIFYSPLWFPFWFADKLHKAIAKIREAKKSEYLKANVP